MHNKQGSAWPRRKVLRAKARRQAGGRAGMRKVEEGLTCTAPKKEPTLVRSSESAQL